MLDTIDLLHLNSRSYLSGQPLSKSLELRQELYQEAIRVYKRYVSLLRLVNFQGRTVDFIVNKILESKTKPFS